MSAEPSHSAVASAESDARFPPRSSAKTVKPHRATSSLAEILDATRREERREALRALLMRPILFDIADRAVASGVESKVRDNQFIQTAFVLVRRHADYLTHWFARYTGWTLILRSDSVRLVKRSVNDDDVTRGASDLGTSSAPLNRSRYAMWCLMMVILHDEGRQTTLRRIAEQTTRLAASMPELADESITFDLKSAATRRSLVCVIRLAIRHGILHRIGGDEDRFATSEQTDCLYNIHRGLLTDVLAQTPEDVRKTQSHLTDPANDHRVDHLINPNQDEQALLNREIEHRLMWRLLDDPIVYFEELTEREFAYFQSQRSRLFDVIEAATGLVPELRGEGVAMLDPVGGLTDVRMPDAGTVGHATLLLAEFLSERQQTAVEVSHETLLTHLRALSKKHRSDWKQGLNQSSGLETLLADCLHRLEALRMVRVSRQYSVTPLPAIARFVAEPSEPISPAVAKRKTKPKPGSDP